MIKRIVNQASIIIGIILLIGTYYYVKRSPKADLNTVIEEIAVWKLILGAMLYLLSHFVRSMRLAIMVGREDISIRGIVTTQFYTNGVNLILPFKLGEVYRLYEFHKLIKRYKASVSAIIAEKSLDFFFLFGGLLVSYYYIGNVSFNLDFTLLICSSIVLVLLLVIIVLPQNIRSFNLFLAKRYSSERLVRLLSFTSKLHSIISEINQLFKEKIATLMVMTILVWGLEIMAFLIFIPFLPNIELLVFLAFLTFLSVFLPSGSFGFGGVQLAFYCIYLIDKDFPFLELSLVYQAFLFLPAIIISAILFLNQWFYFRKTVKKEKPIVEELVVRNRTSVSLQWRNPLAYSLVQVSRIFKTRIKS